MDDLWLTAANPTTQPGAATAVNDRGAVNESMNEVSNWVTAFLNGLKGGIMALKTSSFPALRGLVSAFCSLFAWMAQWLSFNSRTYLQSARALEICSQVAQKNFNGKKCHVYTSTSSWFTGSPRRELTGRFLGSLHLWASSNRHRRTVSTGGNDLL